MVLQKGVCERGRRKYLKEEKCSTLSPWLDCREDEDMVEFHCSMKRKQAELLSMILFRSDYSDRKQFEEDIYNFGGTLRQQDRLGRAIFVCLASLMYSKPQTEQVF